MGYSFKTMLHLENIYFLTSIQLVFKKPLKDVVGVGKVTPIR